MLDVRSGLLTRALFALLFSLSFPCGVADQTSGLYPQAPDRLPGPPLRVLSRSLCARAARGAGRFPRPLFSVGSKWTPSTCTWPIRAVSARRTRRSFSRSIYQNSYSALVETWQLEAGPGAGRLADQRTRQVRGNVSPLYKIRIPADRVERAETVEISTPTSA